MDYECPGCGSEQQPIIIIRFPPQIFQCEYCGRKGNDKDFIKKKKPKFTPLPQRT